MEDTNTKSDIQKYFCVDDKDQKEKSRNTLNSCFEIWCLRGDILAVEPLDLQIKALEDMSLNINSFCFLSAEAQEYIINNCEKYKNVLEERLAKKPNFFFNCNKNIKKLASKYFDIEYDEGFENRREIDRNFKLNSDFKKMLSDDLTQHISAGYCHTKSAWVGLNMYLKNQDSFDESGYEDLKKQFESEDINTCKSLKKQYELTKTNELQNFNSAEPIFGYLKEKYNVDSVIIKNDNVHVSFWCSKLLSRFHGALDCIPIINELILNGNPIGVQVRETVHIQPVINSREVREQFAKALLKVDLINYLYMIDFSDNGYVEPGDLFLAFKFLKEFLVSGDEKSNLAERKPEQEKALEEKLNQIFEHVPDKSKAREIIKLCYYVIDEFSICFIDGYKYNKNLDYSTWLFEKIDNFSNKFLSIYKNETEKENKDNNDLNVIIEKKDNEINELKEQIKEMSEKNKAEDQNELEKKLKAAKNDLKQKDDKIKELENKNKDKTQSNFGSSLKDLKHRNIFGIICGSGELIFGTANFILLLVIQTTNPVSLLLITITIIFYIKGGMDIAISATSMHKIRKTPGTQEITNKNGVENKSDDIYL